MQIHELNNFNGNLDAGTYAVLDNGIDTGKISVPSLTKNVEDEIEAANRRIDNIITSPAPSEQEIIDAREGENGFVYSSLGDAIREQVGELKSDVFDTLIDVNATNFAERVGSYKIQTELTDIDPGAITYSGRFFTSAGAWTTSQNYSCYAFRSPQDNFAISANVADLAIVASYPDNNESTVDIISQLITGQTSGYTDIIIPNRGDIVIFNAANTVPIFLLTNVGGPYKTDGLILEDANDMFLRYAVFDSALSARGNSKLNVTKAAGRLVNATYGSLTTNASYDTYYFKVPVPELNIRCTNGFRAAIVRLEPEDDGAFNFSRTESLKQLLYTYPAQRVDEFVAHYGDYVCISISSSDTLDLSTDYAPTFTLPGLVTDAEYMSQFYRYSADVNGKYLNVYFTSGDHVVGYELHNVPSPGINSDTWQLGAIYSYEFDGNSLSNGVELVEPGEFEIALKEHGAADFCGGNNHGDEKTDSFVLHIDGKLISDLSTLDNDFHVFDRIDAFEIATINRCDTPGDNIAKHQKIWIFEDGKVKVRQTLKFLQAISLDGWLCTMMKAKRTAFPYGIRQGNVAIEDMTTSSFTPLSTTGNDMMYMFYGNNATAKVTARTEDHTPEARLWIDPQSTGNKLYFTFFGTYSSGSPGSIAANSIYHCESEYDIAYNS